MSYLLNTGTPPPITIFLDSRFATQYLETDADGFNLTTNYIYTLKEPINVPNNMNVLLQLNSATIPYSFYNLREIVNDIVFIRYVHNGATLYTFVQLDDGNYTSNSLASEVISKVNTAFSGFGMSLTMTYNRIQQRYTFSFTTTDVNFTQLSFSFTQETIDNEAIGIYVNRPANKLLGIRDLTEITMIRNGASATSNMVVDINDNIHGLYIRQNLSTKQTLDNSTGVLSNILERLPITTNAGGVIFYSNENGHKTMIDTNHIQNIGIRLTDDKHRSIDLNGLHFQISLVISFIYKEVSKIERGKNNRRIMENFRLLDERIPIDNSKKLKIKKKDESKKKK